MGRWKSIDMTKLKFDDRGLIPVVAQDANDGVVLMVAYMNKESLQLTIDTGVATYWSRSRQKLWKKGESSGNIQNVADILTDCDGDTCCVPLN
jgi:phosphoribosyl-AMP cyclohydrolase